MSAPRTLHVHYHADRLAEALSILAWLSLFGGALVVGFVLHAGGGAPLAVGAGVAGIGGAVSLALAKGLLILVSDIRDAVVATHNLIGEQAPSVAEKREAL